MAGGYDFLSSTSDSFDPSPVVDEPLNITFDTLGNPIDSGSGQFISPSPAQTVSVNGGPPVDWASIVKQGVSIYNQIKYPGQTVGPSIRPQPRVFGMPQNQALLIGGLILGAVLLSRKS